MNDIYSRVLITGAQGFVGRYLVPALLTQSPTTRVLGVGRSPRQDEFFTHTITHHGQETAAPLPPEIRESLSDRRYCYAIADIERDGDLASILADFRPDCIFHLASALRDESPTRLLGCNVQGTINLLSAIARSDLQGARVVLGSSAAVYGDVAAADLPVSECYPVNPVGMYGVSKHAAELAARALAKVHGFDLVIARLFNLVGPGQEERHVCAQLVSQLVCSSTGSPSPAVRVGRLDTARDFVDVRDAAQALVLLAEHGAPGETYNVASGIETSIREVLDHCLTLAGDVDRARVQVTAGREGDVLRSVADVSRLHELGFAPNCCIRESLSALFDYYNQAITLRTSAADQGATSPQDEWSERQLPPYGLAHEATVVPTSIQDVPQESTEGCGPRRVRQ